MINIGINGFGRIGRHVFKIISEKYKGKIRVVAVNDIADTETLVHLLKYDSIYGQFEGLTDITGNSFKLNGEEITFFNGSLPERIPWETYDIDIVIESTPIFRDRKSCMGHISRGVKKVIISSPSKDAEATLVMGVNEGNYDPVIHTIVSNASCTTNALAPIVKAIDEVFGVKSGMMTTIHSYTSDQRILDYHHRDVRRARAAAQNIIPTTTGAAIAIGKVFPHLKGRLTGMSVRVPTPTVSMIDFTVLVQKNTSVVEVNELFKKIADEDRLGIVGYSDEKLVSSDYRGSSYSTVIDAHSTEVLDGRMIKIVAWYDNEWGYSTRLADMTAYIAEFIMERKND
ncbi:MAG: type I glyceraldehyde-3-phosphate dehydrogenase [Clostridiales bacterium]|nr:type I glyceraldehyde-3-phosphate dehydrogenase [Clostridiales bacterium]